MMRDWWSRQQVEVMKAGPLEYVAGFVVWFMVVAVFARCGGAW